MKKENRFILIFSSFIILIFLTGYYLSLYNILSKPDWIAFISGGLLTTLNFYTGVFSIRIALRSEQDRFMSILFGGMLIRLAILLGAVYTALKILEIKRDVFIFVIFIFYSIYLISEIIYFYLLKGRTD